LETSGVEDFIVVIILECSEKSLGRESSPARGRGGERGTVRFPPAAPGFA
jgi:hypothetical protein